MVCTENCINYVASDRACRDGAQYPGAIRAPDGDRSVTMTCRILEGRFVLTMPPDETYIRMIAQQDDMTITAALDAGQSATFSFSLSGAYPAIYIILALGAMISGQPAGTSPQG